MIDRIVQPSAASKVFLGPSFDWIAPAGMATIVPAIEHIDIIQPAVATSAWKYCMSRIIVGGTLKKLTPRNTPARNTNMNERQSFSLIFEII